MPYSKDHKPRTRARIVEAARVLFNRHGFEGVTIDMIMQEAGLTRGGFYNHFSSKDELFSAAVESFLMGRGAKWRDDAGIDPTNLNPDMARQMLASYLSEEHLNTLDGQCPMIALPSDIARGSEAAQESYQTLLQAMVWLFERSLSGHREDPRSDALALAALSVGGMVLARTLPASLLAREVRQAAHGAAVNLMSADPR